MVVICGENNYKLDTSHVIEGVVVEGTREGEVYGSIPNNSVAREFCAKNAATCTGCFIMCGYGGPNKNKFFYYF
jgi:hypothetical protein